MRGSAAPSLDTRRRASRRSISEASIPDRSEAGMRSPPRTFYAFPDESGRKLPPITTQQREVELSAEQAKAYLNFLYSDEGQEIAAKHAIRPTNQAILKKYGNVFKPITLFRVEDYFGSFAEAQKVHFNDGGQFDKLYTVK